MIKESEKVKRKMPSESESTSLKKIKLSLTTSQQSKSTVIDHIASKSTSELDSKFCVTITKLLLHQDREKGIQLFKSVLLSDYSKEQITEEFEQHVVDIAYQIENGKLNNIPRDLQEERHELCRQGLQGEHQGLIYQSQGKK